MLLGDLRGATSALLDIEDNPQYGPRDRQEMESKLRRAKLLDASRAARYILQETSEELWHTHDNFSSALSPKGNAPVLEVARTAQQRALGGQGAAGELYRILLRNTSSPSLSSISHSRQYRGPAEAMTDKVDALVSVRVWTGLRAGEGFAVPRCPDTRQGVTVGWWPPTMAGSMFVDVYAGTEAGEMIFATLESLLYVPLMEISMLRVHEQEGIRVEGDGWEQDC